MAFMAIILIVDGPYMEAKEVVAGIRAQRVEIHVAPVICFSWDHRRAIRDVLTLE
jgi:hypothetical protein